MATIPTVVRYSPEGLRVIVNAHEAATWEAQGFTEAPPQPAAPSVPPAPVAVVGGPAAVGAVDVPITPRASHKGPRKAPKDGDAAPEGLAAKLSEAVPDEPPGPVTEATIA